jgi:hypothetical protein
MGRTRTGDRLGATNGEATGAAGDGARRGAVGARAITARATSGMGATQGEGGCNEAGTTASSAALRAASRDTSAGT